MYPQQQQQLDRVDIEAIEASLPDLGAVVAEIGMQKAVADYSKDEILRLICEAYRSVERHRMRIIGQEEIPFQ